MRVLCHRGGPLGIEPGYEDEHVIAFMDVRPVTTGHLLVVPRAHAESLGTLAGDLGARLFRVAHRLVLDVTGFWQLHKPENDMPDQPFDHAGLEPLSFDTCLELLASAHLGRIGFLADGEVVILPINHAMDGQDVVFRTSRGSKLAAAGEQGLVAFETDAYDSDSRSGWSVLVNGRATVVYEDAEIRRLSQLGLDHWAANVAHPFWIRIRPASVTGRRTPQR